MSNVEDQGLEEPTLSAQETQDSRLTTQDSPQDSASSRRSLFIGLAIGGLLSLIFFGGLWAGMALERSRASTGADISDPALQNFLSAYHLVTEKSYYKPLDKKRLLYAAIDGMLKETGDPHTLFLTPPENKDSNTALNGSNFGGIGTMVFSETGALRIWAVMPNSPAARAGLHDDDLITAINGHPVSGMTSEDAVTRIHGTAGTTVLLAIRRGRTTFIVPVKRQVIDAVTAYGRMLPHRLGYVNILSFGDHTAAEVRSALGQLVQQHASGIILDLRDDPGGYVDAAQSVVSYFVSSGVVAYEKSDNKDLAPLSVQEGQKIVGVPVAILVNQETASAAEITAAALRIDDHAVLIGTRTYGKGSMQSVYTLSDGSSVRITDRLWLTPDKKSVSGKGLQPDIPIGLNAPGRDPGLTAAEKYLSRHPAG